MLHQEGQGFDNLPPKPEYNPIDNHENGVETKDKKKSHRVGKWVAGVTIAGLAAGGVGFGAYKASEQFSSPDEDTSTSANKEPGDSAEKGEQQEVVTQIDQVLLKDSEIDQLIEENKIPSGLSDEEFVDKFYAEWTEAVNAGKEVGDKEFLDEYGTMSPASLIMYDGADSSYDIEDWSDLMAEDQSQWWGDVLMGPEENRGSGVTKTLEHATMNMNSSVVLINEQTKIDYERTFTPTEILDVEENSDGGRTFHITDKTSDNLTEVWPDRQDLNVFDGSTYDVVLTTAVSENGTEYASSFKATKTN